MNMKEKLKTLAIIILLIISLILIIVCRSYRDILYLHGHNFKNRPIIENDCERFSDQFEMADSMFREKHDFPLTR